MWTKIRLSIDKWLDTGASHELMCYQKIYGKFFVIYKDKKRSVKMSYSAAKELCRMFGGEVHHIKYGLAWKESKN